MALLCRIARLLCGLACTGSSRQGGCQAGVLAAIAIHAPSFSLRACPLINAGGAAGRGPCFSCAPNGGSGALRRAAAAGRHLPGVLLGQKGATTTCLVLRPCQVHGFSAAASRGKHGFSAAVLRSNARLQLPSCMHLDPPCRPQRCGAASPRQTCWASPAASWVGCGCLGRQYLGLNGVGCSCTGS